MEVTKHKVGYWTLGSILPTFYEQLLRQISFAKKLQSQTVSGKKLQKHFWAEKLHVKR